MVEIVDEPHKIEAFLPILDEMMGEGMVTVEPVRVITYRHHAGTRTPAAEGGRRRRRAPSGVTPRATRLAGPGAHAVPHVHDVADHGDAAQGGLPPYSMIHAWPFQRSSRRPARAGPG